MVTGPAVLGLGLVGAWLLPMVGARVMPRSMIGLIVSASLTIGAVGIGCLVGFTEASGDAVAASVDTLRAAILFVPLAIWSVSRGPRRWSEDDWLDQTRRWGGEALWFHYHGPTARLTSTGDDDADYKRRGDETSAGSE